MAANNCNIRIELDDDEHPPRCPSSEPLSGTVYVDVGEQVDCDGLILRPRWETSGRGDQASGGPDGQHLFEGTWQPGQVYEYPFDLELPPGPYTYRGHYIEVDWKLEAEANVGWPVEPSSEREFILEPGGDDEFVPGQKTADEFEASRPDVDSSVSGGMVAFGALLAVLPIGLSVVMTSGPGGNSLLATLVVALFSGGLGGWVMYRGMYKAATQSWIGDIDVEVSNSQLVPGEEVECRVTIRPADEIDTEINRVTCKLRNYERAISTARGSDLQRTVRHTETLSESEDVPEDSISATVEGNGSSAFVSRLRVPEEVAYSFEAEKNEVNWEIEVSVDFPAWPTWTHAEPILVGPEPSADEAGPDGEAEADNGGEISDGYSVTW